MQGCLQPASFRALGAHMPPDMPPGWQLCRSCAQLEGGSPAAPSLPWPCRGAGGRLAGELLLTLGLPLLLSTSCVQPCRKAGCLGHSSMCLSALDIASFFSLSLSLSLALQTNGCWGVSSPCFKRMRGLDGDADGADESPLLGSFLSKRQGWWGLVLPAAALLSLSCSTTEETG